MLELHVFNETSENRPGFNAFDDKLELIAGAIRGLGENDVRSRFSLAQADVLIKTTLSLCPDCLTHVPAAVVRREHQIRMLKICSEHGSSEVILENDADYYRISSKDRWGRVYDAAPARARRRSSERIRRCFS